MKPETRKRVNSIEPFQTDAVNRGKLVLENLLDLNFASLVQRIEQISQEYDKDKWYEATASLQVDTEAIRALDACDPPVPYPFYFCTSDILIQYPELITYYRNVAMVPEKAMRDMGLNTAAYEAGRVPPLDVAVELAHCFNRIVSVLVTTGEVTPRRHLEMAYVNLGASFGGAQDTDLGDNSAQIADEPARQQQFLNDLAAFLDG
jgi:hypothetical protein